MADAGHRYFIEVLREIHNILLTASRRWRSTTQPAARTPAPKPTKDTEREAKTSLANLFENLEFEQTSQEPLGSEPQLASRTSSPPKPATECAYGSLEIDDRSEAEFALWCFLRDLHDLKDFVRASWKQYSDGELSFFAASAVTNTAFGIMRRAGEEVSKTHPWFYNLQGVLNFLGIFIGGCPLGEPQFVRKTEERTVPLSEKAKMNILLCPKAAVALAYIKPMWLRFMGEKADALAKEGTKAFETQPRRANTSLERVALAQNLKAVVHAEENTNFSPDEMAGFWSALTYHPFAMELVKHAMEFAAFFQADTTGPRNFADEFIGAMSRMYWTGVTPVWLVVACQTYMDIWNVVNPFPGAAIGVQELRKASQQTQETEQAYKKMFAMEAKDSCGIFDDQMTAHSNFDCQVTDWLSGVPPAATDVEFTNGADVQDGVGNSVWIPSGLYQSLPLWLGDRVYNHKMARHVASAARLNDGSIILGMVHVYK